MDNVFQKIHKKICSSEKKINGRLAKCYLFNKARLLHQSAPSQPSTRRDKSNQELNDALVMVARPPPDVRLVLFKEFGDTCDRKIVFDSKSLQKVEIPKQKCSAPSSAGYPNNNSNVETKPQYEYQYIRSLSDWNVLSEMLFGSVGMAQKAASLKIHYIKDPPTVMLSRVFCLPSFKDNATVSLDRGIENHIEMQRANSVLSRRKAQTMPVPASPQVMTPPLSVASSYSGNSGVFHRTDSSTSLSSLFSTSYQSAFTPLQTGSLGTGAIRMPSAPHARAHSLPKHQRDSFTLHEESSSDKVNSVIRRTRMRIGFAVLCQPEPSNAIAFQQFFFEHFPIIESHMTALKGDIEKAFQSKPNFLRLMMKALNTFSAKLHTMYSTTRLPEPVWSTLTSSPSISEHRTVVVNSFIGDLARLVADCNTKPKNQFVTGLLTAVLTHHLGWVASATPSNGRKHENEENSYNALWAQLGDLYGAVGSPTKVCRTVVTGNGHELVSTFLSVLSYFIRSAHIDDVIPVPERITPISVGVQRPLPEKLRLSLVPCDIEDDEYVFVSVTDEADEVTPSSSPTKIKSSPKATVLRSKSSPNHPSGDSQSALSRSYSGPMVKTAGPRQRSNAILESKTSIGHRTFSNSAMSKNKSVQSRRKSHDVADLAVPANHTHHGFSMNAEYGKATSSTSLNIHGSFCMKQNVNIDWPEVPTHMPGAGISLKPEKVRKLSTSLQNISSDKEQVCRVMSSHVDRIPPVAHLVNVQRSSPRIDATECVLSTLPTNPVPKFLASDGSSAEPTRNSPEPGNTNDAQPPPKVPTRSQSNPSVCAKDSVKPGHRRNSSNTGGRVRIGTRRHQLPTSPPPGDCVSNTNGNSVPETGDHARAESPSFRRIKLLRIPSVEMNHNVFDEYFESGLKASKEADGDHARHFSESSSALGIINEQTSTEKQSTTHHVASCPNFKAQVVQQKPPLSSRKTAKIPQRDQKQNATALQEKAVPSIYPRLPSDTNPPPVPSPRRQSGEISVRKIYPPLPAKPPVGLVSFNVGNEQVSFHNPVQSKTDHNDIQIHVAPKPNPRRHSSAQSEATIMHERATACDANLKELPLADIDFSPTRSTRSDDKRGGLDSGFTSLMADYNQDYLNDFILHGARNSPDMHRKILHDLDHVIRNPTLDEPIAEAVCILADTDTWSVKVYSSQRLHSDKPSLPALTSKLVCNILNRIAYMYITMKVSPDFCMTFLESELRQLVLKSRMLAEYTRGHKRVTVAQLTAVLGIEKQDLPLLMAIASCHSPHVAPIMSLHA